MTTAKYVPQQAIEQGALVAWTVRMGVLTPEALAEREEVSVTAARERLDAAVSLGYLTRKSVLVGYPSLYTVTRAGRSLARKHQQAGGYVYRAGLRTCRVRIQGARHTIACAGGRAALERRYPDHCVSGELELCIDEREQGRRLATVETQGVGGGEGRVHHPDLVIWPPATPVPPDTPDTPDKSDAPPPTSDMPATPDKSDAPPPTSDMPATPLLPVAVEVELTSKGRGGTGGELPRVGGVSICRGGVVLRRDEGYRGEATRCDRGVRGGRDDRGQPAAGDPQPSARIPLDRRVAAAPQHPAAPVAPSSKAAPAAKRPRDLRVAGLLSF